MNISEKKNTGDMGKESDERDIWRKEEGESVEEENQ